MSPLGAPTLYVEMAPIRLSSHKVHRKGGLDTNRVNGEDMGGGGGGSQSGFIRAAYKSVSSLCASLQCSVTADGMIQRLYSPSSLKIFTMAQSILISPSYVQAK